MTNRIKRIRKAIESYEAEIENHFRKLDKELEERDDYTARYHIKELDRSLIISLEKKLAIIKDTKKQEKIESFRKRLTGYKKKLGIDE